MRGLGSLLLAVLLLGVLLPLFPTLSPQPVENAVIVELREGVDPQPLKAYGFLETVVGGVATLRPWPWIGIEEINRLDIITGVQRPRSFRLLLDESVPEIHAPQVWREFQDRYGRPADGSGVAIAFIDTGIDYSHPDFSFPNGSTRILAIWDQTTEGKPPKGFSYGYECLREEIENGSCPEYDEMGHGTHIASIAAGAGRMGPYRGVAPGAYLIVVKSGRPACNGEEWFMDEDEIIDGIHYVVEKARELGLRLVINLSIGSDSGAHDGSTPIEKVIDELSEKGVIVVVAAGNSAEDGIHAMGDFTEIKEFTLNWMLAPQTREFQIDLALDSDELVEVELHTPYGSTARNQSLGPINVEISSNIYEAGRDVIVYVSLAKYYRGDLMRKPWSLRVRALKTSGEAVWHAWINSDTCSISREHFTPSSQYNVTESYTVSIPATARNAIAVGAYVTKNRWTNIYGETHETVMEKGELLYFSGRGPTRDGRVKPDLTAPGSLIVAAKSSSSPASGLDVNEYYTVKQGTSMSAPHVAGAAAIILQLFPHASPRDVYLALTSSARWSEDMGLERPSNKWGWGKLDARAFYKIMISVEGLSPTLETSLRLDDEALTLYGGESIGKIFLRDGRTHELNATPIIALGKMSRYRLMEYSRFFDDSANITLNYVLEHLLIVESEFNYEAGGGWYPNGSIAYFSARRLLPPQGLEIFFKPSISLSGWIDEQGRFFTESWIVMDRPHRVKAVYNYDYKLMVLSWLAVAVTGATLPFIVRRVYSMRVREGGEMRETKFHVEIKTAEKAFRVSRKVKDALKGAVSGKMMRRMSREYVECPVAGKIVPFLECFACVSFIRRVKGIVHCTGEEYRVKEQ